MVLGKWRMVKSSLWRQVHRGLHVPNNSLLVFGSNTDVGKTLVSTGLLKFKPSSRQGLYVKPVQTGDVHDAHFVHQHCQLTESLSVRTLYHWKLATSPHIAARSSPNIPADSEVVRRIQEEMESFLRRFHDCPTFVLVESAGGVLSPGPSGSLQASMYHRLRLPAVLVGDSRLGGISATIAAYEALFTRAYQIPIIVLIDSDDGLSDQYGNAAFLDEYFQKLHAKSTSSLTETPHVIRLTPIPSDKSIPLNEWFDKNQSSFSIINNLLDSFIFDYDQKLLQMHHQGMHRVWWPFTQHQNVSKNDVTLIESAQQDDFHTITSFEQEHQISDEVYVNGLATRNMFDACASWWTQVTF